MRRTRWWPTRDSRRILFSSTRSGPINIYLQAADGTGEARRLFESTYAGNPTSVTPDGTRVIFRRDGSTTGTGGGQDIMSASIDGASTPTVVLATKANERSGEVSPDGKGLAYESDESGPLEVYVRPFPDVQSGRWQVSFGGGVHPAWNPAGRELFFVASDGKLMGVQVTPGTTFTTSQPRVVINSRVFAAYTPRSYDVSPDGKRFLIVEPTGAGESSSASITVVLNWAEELKRRLK